MSASVEKRGTGKRVSNALGFAGSPFDGKTVDHELFPYPLETVVGHRSQGLVEDSFQRFVVGGNHKMCHPPQEIVAFLNGPKDGSCLQLHCRVVPLSCGQSTGATLY